MDFENFENNDHSQAQEKDTSDMLELQFKPETEKEEFIKATEEYREIWQQDGERMIRTLEDMTGLEFQESRINVEVFEGISWAGRGDKPMKLRGSYPPDFKKGTIVHELSHRLLSGNGIISLTDEGQIDSLGAHKQIDLFLYDAWVNLYGTAFADKQVEIESGRVPFYREAWEWALQMTPQERAAELQSLISNDL